MPPPKLVVTRLHGCIVFSQLSFLIWLQHRGYAELPSWIYLLVLSGEPLQQSWLVGLTSTSTSHTHTHARTHARTHTHTHTCTTTTTTTTRMTTTTTTTTTTATTTTTTTTTTIYISAATVSVRYRLDPTKQRHWLWHRDFTGQHTATLTNSVSSDRTCRRRGLMFDTGSGGPTRSASFGTAAYPLHMHTHYPSIMTNYTSGDKNKLTRRDFREASLHTMFVKHLLESKVDCFWVTVRHVSTDTESILRIHSQTHIVTEKVLHLMFTSCSRRYSLVCSEFALSNDSSIEQIRQPCTAYARRLKLSYSLEESTTNFRTPLGSGKHKNLIICMIWHAIGICGHDNRIVAMPNQCPRSQPNNVNMMQACKDIKQECIRTRVCNAWSLHYGALARRNFK